MQYADGIAVENANNGPQKSDAEKELELRVRVKKSEKATRGFSASCT